MNEKKSIFDKLEVYIKPENKQAWIGTKPLVDADIVFLKKSSNFRVGEKFRQQYNVVWLIEDNLFNEYMFSWMLVIDEILRLFNDQGILIVRTSDNETGTLYALKSFLYRKINVVVILENQFVSENDTITIFKIERKNLEIYKDKSWTFGILSDGRKEQNVINLVKKIINISKHLKVEFLIAGPEINELVELDGVHFICNDLDALPRIAEKKNKIISSSKYCNVALFHDRYIVDENFFLGFEEFGYDFDYVTVKQLYPSGAEFPAYLMFKENKKTWQTPIFTPQYNEVCSSSFLNGGLLIVKKKIAGCINFNPLLLHNEAEDVEYAMQLFSVGIVPRINSIAKAHTIGIDESYTDTFILNDNFSSPKLIKSSIKKIFRCFWVILPVSIKLKIKNLKVYGKVKSIYRN